MLVSNCCVIDNILKECTIHIYMYSETTAQNIVSSLLRNSFACPQVLVEWLCMVIKWLSKQPTMHAIYYCTVKGVLHVHIA